MRNTVILSLGSNIEPREYYIRSAVYLVKDFVNVLKVSSLYESKPWGVLEQNNFYNVSLIGITKLNVWELFRRIKEVERNLGRVERFRWGPREIDIDIIYYGNLMLKTSILTLPHIHRLERSFVIIPTFEIAYDFVDPEYKLPISKIVKKFLGDSSITLLRSKFL